MKMHPLFRILKPLPARQREKAFTLTELLVAIAIVAILAALLTGSLKKAKSSADTVKCLSKLRQLGVAAKTYVGENNGLRPYRPDNPNWMFNLAPYLGLAPTKKAGNEPMTDAFLCPADPSDSPRQMRTYRFQQSFPSPMGAPNYGRSNYVPSRALEIVRPSTLAMIFCVAYTGPRPLQLWRYDEAIWKESVDKAMPPDEANNYPRPHYHGKAVNILYSDGHAAKAAYPLPPETYHFDGQ